MKLNTKILNNKYLTHIVIIVLLLIIIVLIYIHYFMGSKKYREFFDEDKKDKLKDDDLKDTLKDDDLNDKLINLSQINTNNCKSNTCNGQENGPSSKCMHECCRNNDCKDKSKVAIKVNGKTSSEFVQCMENCTDP